VEPAKAAIDWADVQKVAASFEPPLTLVSPAPTGKAFDNNGRSKWLDWFFRNCTDVFEDCNPDLIMQIAFHGKQYTLQESSPT